MAKDFQSKLFIRKSSDGKYILISDLYIATYLVCKEIKLEGIKKSATFNKKAYFLFDVKSLKDIVSCVKEFLSGRGVVHANIFSAETKKMKSLVNGLMESSDPEIIEEGNSILITEDGIFETREK